MNCTCLKLTGSCTCKNNCQKTSSENINYVGPDLPCSGIEVNDNMSVVTQKLNEAICGTSGACSVWEGVFTVYALVQAVAILTVDGTLGETSVTSEYIDVGRYSITFNDLPFNLEENSVVLTSPSPAIGTIISASVSGNVLSINLTNTTGTLIDININTFGIHIKHCTTVQ